MVKTGDFLKKIVGSPEDRGGRVQNQAIITGRAVLTA